jgi:uncharacterized protein (DUF1778 family)
MATTTTKETRLEFRVSDREKGLMQKAADARGLSLSAWVRMIALDAAKREKAR